MFLLAIARQILVKSLNFIDRIFVAPGLPMIRLYADFIGSLVEKDPKCPLSNQVPD
jgi:hypothetical protein